MKRTFELAAIFTDNMVFQTGKPIKIFGKCKKNLEIQFRLLEQEINLKTKTDSFMVEFPAMEVQESAFSITISTKKEKHTLYNCLIGDVYLFLGGMNLTLPLSESFHNQDYENLNVRFFSLEDESHSWQVTDKDNFETFSALAYLFAKGVNDVLQTPVGIINFAYKDSRIFSWMSMSDIEANKEIKLLSSKYKSDDRFPLYKYLKEMMIPHYVKAIIFYHGENDYPFFSIYENALKSIIKCLRFDYTDFKLAFFIIQIAGYNHPKADDYSISLIRIAQARVASDKDVVYLVSAIDFGDEEEINPKDKDLIAKRLANLVLEKLYKIGKNNSSPTLFSYQILPDSITILTKDNYLNLVSKSGQYLGFTCSENGVDFYPLKNISITNNIIAIKRDKNFNEIRYAMKKYPICDIITTNNLPLLPFHIKF